MKLGGSVHCTKSSPEFECQGQRSKVKVTGDKKRKSAAVCSEVVLWGAVLVRYFSGAVLGGVVLYAGGKSSACSLVTPIISSRGPSSKHIRQISGQSRLSFHTSSVGRAKQQCICNLQCFPLLVPPHQVLYSIGAVDR